LSWDRRRSRNLYTFLILTVLCAFRVCASVFVSFSFSLCKCVIKVSLVFFLFLRMNLTRTLSYLLLLYIYIYTEPVFTPSNTYFSSFPISFVCLFFSFSLSLSLSLSSLQSQSVTVERCYRTGGWVKR